jgi:nucleoside-triphosphatase THEP1
MRKIKILTGPKGHGKSSLLRKQYAGREGADGILTLRRDMDQRDFQLLSSGQTWPMEGEEGYSGPWLKVGRFCFSEEAFRRAEKFLLEAASAEKNHTLIIDEIGPLELGGEGFFRVLRILLDQVNGLDLILVVRSELLKEVQQFFGLESAQVLTCESFEE